jgi:DNA-binding beta-propeller fold protein YncE
VQVFELDSLSNNFIPIREWDIIGWYGQSLDNKPYLQVDQSGHVFVSDPEGYRILEFTNEGEFVRYWGDYGNGPGSFILPTGLAIDPATGSLWVADAGNHRLMGFSSASAGSP